jgi:hypothetical protein
LLVVGCEEFDDERPLLNITGQELIFEQAFAHADNTGGPDAEGEADADDPTR